MRSPFFGNMEQAQLPGHFALQNPRMLRIHLNGDVLARQGSMVAFQGQMDFDYEGSGSVGRFLKKALTGEGVPTMRVRGQGLLFLAHNADDIHLFYLENETLTVNGANILAWDPHLHTDIQRVQGAGILAGGLFNTTLTGTGWVAITAHGTPVLLDPGRAPTFVDGQSAVCWSGGLQVGVNKTFKVGALIGRGSGEAVQLAFQGQGFVLVQASEGPTVPPHTH
ncbi:AIM24 family protein [Thermomonospora catenispora]|uniref:AIM24 family protein n=1 Tax=Thermomonospora catenispora TaxID=2493090 RepID=UPI001124B984|nr:AIM24 family protein [Thermomonospora catenispora]TNY38483.1 AIM24 family protein [Thermomonospora catenispora]